MPSSICEEAFTKSGGTITLKFHPPEEDSDTSSDESDSTDGSAAATWYSRCPKRISGRCCGSKKHRRSCRRVRSIAILVVLLFVVAAVVEFGFLGILSTSGRSRPVSTVTTDRPVLSPLPDALHG
ncbi:hypothetical protein C8039_11255 [Halogeometricum sp. wsp3]|nr:hypothetical protein C8039_11255 [Halogeometricum sp. wsp3]